MAIHPNLALQAQQLRSQLDEGSTLAACKAWFWGRALQHRARRGDVRAWLDIPYLASVLKLEWLLEEPCFAQVEDPILRAALVEGMRHPEAELFRSRHLARQLDLDWRVRLQPPPPPVETPESRPRLIAQLIREYLQGKPVREHLDRMNAWDQAETVLRYVRWAHPSSLPENLRAGPSCSEIDQKLLDALQVRADFQEGKLVACHCPWGHSMELHHENRSGRVDGGGQEWVYRAGTLESFSCYDDTSVPRPYSWEKFIALGLLTCAGLDSGF